MYQDHALRLFSTYGFNEMLWRQLLLELFVYTIRSRFTLEENGGVIDRVLRMIGRTSAFKNSHGIMNT